MLFRGLSNEEAARELWRCAKTNGWGVEHWQDIVGYDPRMKDENVFRVLEWGGMEVLG